jgi:hypothetical protein
VFTYLSLLMGTPLSLSAPPMGMVARLPVFVCMVCAWCVRGCVCVLGGGAKSHLITAAWLAAACNGDVTPRDVSQSQQFATSYSRRNACLVL